jgi:hypothetical protein
MAGWFGEEIGNRDDFFRQLHVARLRSKDLAQRHPEEGPLQYVHEQLDDIARWTSNARTPTLEERKSVYMALTLSRDYEDTEDDEILALRELISGIDAYVTFWPEDKTASDPDNEDYLVVGDA